ncbi:MAG: hypothetical protein SGARI_000157, partial [Bacillariaceae sp.]
MRSSPQKEGDNGSTATAVSSRPSPPSSPVGEVRASKKLLFYGLILIGGLGSMSMLYFVHTSTDAGFASSSSPQWMDHFDLPQQTARVWKDLGGALGIDPTAAANDDNNNQAADILKQDLPQQSQKQGKENKSPKQTILQQPQTFVTGKVAASHANETQGRSGGGLRKSSSSTTNSAVDKEKMRDASDFRPQDDDKPNINTDQEPLNVVLFYADDWTMKVLGKFDPDVKTPHIDNLADNGMLFSNNCVTTSVCWISRASLVTGAYYSRHLQNYPHVEELFTNKNVDWSDSLFPRMKRDGGYFTGLMGKWHAPSPK